MMRRALIALACVSLLVSSGGCKKKKKKHGKDDTAEESGPRHDVKDFVTITVDGGGFHPDKIWATRGKPITLTFDRDSSRGCAGLVIPSEGLRKDLPEDQNVMVPIIPGAEGTIEYKCNDNSHSGVIQVQPPAPL